MKKTFILLLAVVLVACGAPAPTAPAEQAAAPQPAEPVVVTVVVEPTQVPPEPEQPTAVPPEPVVVTVVVEATQAPAAVAPPTEAPAQDPNDTTVALDNAMGKGVFTNMTMSSSNLTLRCFPRDITFNITTPNSDIKDVMFYYRVVDEKRLYPSEWKAFGEMIANGGGNFTLTFSGEDVHPNLRIDGGWLDFQFVGLSKSGDAVDRSEKIESLIKYTFDCE